MEISLPRRGRGQPSKEAKARYEAQVQEFCDKIKVLASRLEFPISSRGWCYYLENERLINKDDFNTCQDLINDCRKEGLLPLNICADDETRSAEGIDDPNDPDIESYARNIVAYVRDGGLSDDYSPYEFTDYQDHYIELLVEKIDLKGIFAPICQKYHIPFANSKGWDDLNSRGNFMKRFKTWERKGKIPVMLYCGDFDPGGLLISDSLEKNIRDLSHSDLNGSGRWSPDNLIIDRFGLNYDFIEANDLTWIDNLITGSEGEIARQLPDGRIIQGKTKAGKPHPDFYKPHVVKYLKDYGVRKVEANALLIAINEGRQLFENTVLQYIDQEGIEKYDRDTNTASGLLQIEITKQLKS
jgi:hypothetical protein